VSGFRKHRLAPRADLCVAVSAGSFACPFALRMTGGRHPGAGGVARILARADISGCDVTGAGGVDVALVNVHGARNLVGVDVQPELVDLATRRAADAVGTRLWLTWTGWRYSLHLARRSQQPSRQGRVGVTGIAGSRASSIGKIGGGLENATAGGHSSAREAITRMSSRLAGEPLPVTSTAVRQTARPSMLEHTGSAFP
jgi:hypothetical protein